MLSVIDVIKGLSEMIETEFPNYPVNDRDISEGFERPSYFIDVEEVVVNNITSEYINETDNLVVYFFAEDIYQGFLDLLEVKEQLILHLKKPLPLKDADGKIVMHIVFDDVNITVQKADKVLTCAMVGQMIQQVEKPDESTYNIENIEVNLVKD